jgi:hypothetical protein
VLAFGDLAAVAWQPMGVVIPGFSMALQNAWRGLPRPPPPWDKELSECGGGKGTMWTSSGGINAPALRSRVLILAAAMLSLSGFTQADIEKAQQAAHFFAGELAKCLDAQTTRLMATNISSQDFALLLKGTCLTEKNKFLVPLVDYIVMKNNAPDSDQAAVLSAANSVIAQYYDVAVKSFIEKRNNR